MSRESFVMIPTSEWESKYKRLEEINEELQYIIDHRPVEIRIHRSYGFGHTYYNTAGHLEIDVNGGYKIKDFDKDQLLYAVEQETGLKLTRTPEAEKELREAGQKVDKLPRFIRWLFNIKTI